MSIITDVLTAGANNHQTTSEAGNFFATDFVTDGVVGAITNTSGVAPSTGAWAVNQNTGTDMNIAISAGVGYVTATPTGQNSQRFRTRNTATITQAIAANATGSTRYDWIYRAIDPTNANVPNAAGDNVCSIVVSRSTSNTVDNGTPPTYGKNIAIVTVTNGATAIVNGNIADKRVQAAATTNVGASYNPYKFSVYRAAAQNSGNNGFAIVNFETKSYDTGSNVDVVTNIGRFTAPVAGWYRFDANVFTGAGGGAQHNLMCALYKNGAEVKRGSSGNTWTGNAGSTVGHPLQLAANDYIEVFAHGDVTLALLIGAATCSFSGFLVSTT